MSLVNEDVQPVTEPFEDEYDEPPEYEPPPPVQPMSEDVQPVTESVQEEPQATPPTAPEPQPSQVPPSKTSHTYLWLAIGLIAIVLVVALIIYYTPRKEQTRDVVYIDTALGADNVAYVVSDIKSSFSWLSSNLDNIYNTIFVIAHAYPNNPRDQIMQLKRDDGELLLTTSLTLTNEKPGSGRMDQSMILFNWFQYLYFESLLENGATKHLLRDRDFDEDVAITVGEDATLNPSGNNLVFTSSKLLVNGIFTKVRLLKEKHETISTKPSRIQIYRVTVNPSKSVSSSRIRQAPAEYVPDVNGQLQRIPLTRSAKTANTIRKAVKMYNQIQPHLSSCTIQSSCCNTAAQIPEATLQRATVAKQPLTNMTVMEHMKEEWLQPEVDGSLDIHGNPHPSPIIPYTFEEHFPMYLKDFTREFYAYWSTLSCIKFYEDVENPNFIIGGMPQCTGTVGKPSNSVSRLNLGYNHRGPSWCWGTNGKFSPSTLYHETIHILGWHHVQNQRDAHKYIKLNAPSTSKQTGQGFFFDFNSIMLYNGYTSLVPGRYRGDGIAAWSILPGTVIDLYKQAMIYCTYLGEDILPDTFLQYQQNKAALQEEEERSSIVEDS